MVMCLWSSLFLIIIFILVSEWLRLKHYMVGGVGHLCAGMNRVRVLYLDQRLSNRLLKKWRWSEIKWKQHKVGRRAIMMREEKIWNLRKVVMCSLELIMWQTLDVCWNQRSWLLNLLVRIRFLIELGLLLIEWPYHPIFRI